MLGELLPDDAATPHQHGECPFGQSTGANGICHQPTHDLGRAGVGVVGHDDDRTACGEGRGGVAASDGVGKRKVAGAEHGDRPERTEHRTMVGLGQRLAVWVGCLDAGIEPVARFDQIGEEAELADRAADLALAAGFRKRGLLRGASDEIGRGGFDAADNRAQECSLLLAGQRRQHGSGGQGEAAGLFDIGGGGLKEVSRKLGRGGGIDAPLGRAGRLAASKTDERLAGKGLHHESDSGEEFWMVERESTNSMAYRRSKRSRFITLVQTATKSLTNFSSPSCEA
jgi:hypothetical protein